MTKVTIGTALFVLLLSTLPFPASEKKDEPPIVAYLGEWSKVRKVTYDRTLVIRYANGEFSWEGKPIKEEVDAYVSELLKEQKLNDVLLVFDGEMKFREVVLILEKFRGTKARVVGFMFEK